MEPALREDDLVLGWKWFRPQPGDIVVAKTLARPIIKRITRISGDEVWLEGDNTSASTDSRHLGTFRIGDIVAKMLIKL